MSLSTLVGLVVILCFMGHWAWALGIVFIAILEA